MTFEILAIGVFSFMSMAFVETNSFFIFEEIPCLGNKLGIEEIPCLGNKLFLCLSLSVCRDKIRTYNELHNPSCLHLTKMAKRNET